MLSAIGLAASGRRNGNSTTLLKSALVGAASAGAQTDLIQLNDLDFHGCRGCLYCKDHGACRLKDGLTPVLSALKLADVWLFSTPVYFDSVSGVFKSCWDRLYQFTYRDGQTKPGLDGKRRGGVILTWEAGPNEFYNKMIASITNYFSWFGNFGEPGVMAESNLGPADTVSKRPNLVAKARELGARLAKEIV